MRHYRFLSTLTLIATLTPCVLSGPAKASPLAYEGFGYTLGASLSGQNGGTGWAGGWVAGNPLALIATPGLTFGGLAQTPGAATATAKPEPLTGDDITFEQRELASLFGADGTTLYLSFLMRPETGFGFYGGINLGGLFVGQSGPTTTYGLEGATIAPSTVEALVDETVLLVVRAQFLAGPDKFDLFINPLPGAEPALSDATMTTFDMGTSSIVTINNAGGWTVDEIRFDQTFADVTPASVPAPPVALLLAVGLVACAFARTRRNQEM